MRPTLFGALPSLVWAASITIEAGGSLNLNAGSTSGATPLDLEQPCSSTSSGASLCQTDNGDLDIHPARGQRVLIDGVDVLARLETLESSSLRVRARLQLVENSTAALEDARRALQLVHGYATWTDGGSWHTLWSLTNADRTAEFVDSTPAGGTGHGLIYSNGTAPVPKRVSASPEAGKASLTLNILVRPWPQVPRTRASGTWR